MPGTLRLAGATPRRAMVTTARAWREVQLQLLLQPDPQWKEARVPLLFWLDRQLLAETGRSQNPLWQ